jgi:hypothetical protein
LIALLPFSIIACVTTRLMAGGVNSVRRPGGGYPAAHPKTTNMA